MIMASEGGLMRDERKARIRLVLRSLDETGDFGSICSGLISSFTEGAGVMLSTWVMVSACVSVGAGEATREMSISVMEGEAMCTSGSWKATCLVAEGIGCLMTDTAVEGGLLSVGMLFSDKETGPASSLREPSFSGSSTFRL